MFAGTCTWKEPSSASGISPSSRRAGRSRPWPARPRRPAGASPSPLGSFAPRSWRPTSIAKSLPSGSSSRTTLERASGTGRGATSFACTRVPARRRRTPSRARRSRGRSGRCAKGPEPVGRAATRRGRDRPAAATGARKRPSASAGQRAVAVERAHLAHRGEPAGAVARDVVRLDEDHEAVRGGRRHLLHAQALVARVDLVVGAVLVHAEERHAIRPAPGPAE